MRGSFGGQKPYLADFELADDLSPDPFSEEPLPHSLPHPVRQRGGRNSKQSKENKSKEKESGE